MGWRAEIDEELFAHVRMCAVVVLGFWLVAWVIGGLGDAPPETGWIFVLLWPVFFVAFPLCAALVARSLVKDGRAVANQIVDERQQQVARWSGWAACALAIGGSAILIALRWAL